jgi:hypothetical protein
MRNVSQQRISVLEGLMHEYRRKYITMVLANSFVYISQDAIKSRK